MCVRGVYVCGSAPELLFPPPSPRAGHDPLLVTSLPPPPPFSLLHPANSNTPAGSHWGNKCLLRAVGFHLQPAQADPHEALGGRPGEVGGRKGGIGGGLVGSEPGGRLSRKKGLCEAQQVSSAAPGSVHTALNSEPFIHPTQLPPHPATSPSLLTRNKNRGVAAWSRCTLLPAAANSTDAL